MLRVGIAQSVERSATGSGVLFPKRERKFSVLHSAQTSSEAHPLFYPVGPGKEGSSPGVKRPGREADNSLLSSAEVENTWIYTFTPPYTIMA
jgi:hypothetical protein